MRIHRACRRLLPPLLAAATVSVPTTAQAHSFATCPIVDSLVYMNVRLDLVTPRWFHFSLGAGGCWIEGDAFGTCTHASGTAVVDDGAAAHRATVLLVAGTMIFVGSASGAFTLHPDVMGGESCLSPSGGADTFVSNGAVVTGPAVHGVTN